MKNIWILTEECPKEVVIETILKKIGLDNKFIVSVKGLQILPVFKAGHFTFIYQVLGVKCKGYKNIFIKIASGNSSFVDFLIFLQINEPDQSSKPTYAIEETKTDDSESRNTGVYQRCSKFVYVEFFYPGIKKIMLYNLSVTQKKKATATNIFGMRMLRTVGVEVLGKVYDEAQTKPFSSLEELIQLKNAMRRPYGNNIPIQIAMQPDRITVSGRLFKAGGIGHDPNIGALTMIALCIRKWEKHKRIDITLHGLEQKHLNANKFMRIAHKLNIGLDGLRMPSAPVEHEAYWHYEISQEKLATIFLHVALLAFTKARIIYSNHGGSERSYLKNKKGESVVISKYQEGKRALYKSGDKTAIIYIPDMIIFDAKRNEIIDVEGKKYDTRKAGIQELKNYNYIDKKIIIPTYKPTSIVRTVAIFGSDNATIVEKEIGFMLNTKGEMILGKKAPAIFKDLIKKISAL